jgi:GNAT superfamily N-acetyltransferase
VRRDLDDGFELDDDPGRVDVDAVHAFISGESYWGRGRSRDLVERAIAESSRVVGLYRGGQQIGFARAVSDRTTVGYLADVYVLESFRGRGLGTELLREVIEADDFAGVRWLLHTADAHELYRRFGFSEEPGPHSLMERPVAVAPAQSPPPQ